MAHIYQNHFVYYLLLFFICYIVTALPGWQLCFDRCYYLNSKVKLVFADQPSYCQSMSGRPVYFGSNSKQTLTTDLSKCHFVKKEHEPYWININDPKNPNNTHCRTIKFSGNNVILEEEVPCLLLLHPICEADKSYCQNFGNNIPVGNAWVTVANQSCLYKLSNAKYTYCGAKSVCEGSWHGKIALGGKDSFMRSLAITIGITQQMMIDFWIESPGIRCPHGQGDGLVIQYTGPAIHTIEKRNSTLKFRMLCKKNDSIPRARSTTATSLPSNTLQTLVQPLTHSTSSPTANQMMTQSNLQTSTTLRETSVNQTAQLTTSRAFPGLVWKTIGQEEYFVNYEPMSYSKAEKFCNEAMNASLVMFLNPVRYFMILEKIALKKSSFWVGAHGMKDECLSYIADNFSLTTSPCHLEKFSVCSRILGRDILRFLEDPKFKTMIQEMTVYKNKTGKRMRQLTSAQDRRRSLRAAGGVGIFIICSVVAILLISDCFSIKRTFFKRKKKQ